LATVPEQVQIQLRCTDADHHEGYGIGDVLTTQVPASACEVIFELPTDDALEDAADRAAGRGRLDRHLRPRVTAVQLYVVAAPVIDGQPALHDRHSELWVHQLTLSPLPDGTAATEQCPSRRTQSTCTVA